MDTDNEKKTATVRPFAKAIVDKTESIKAEAVKSVKSATEHAESEIKKETKKAGSVIKDLENRAVKATDSMVHSATDKAATEKVKVGKMTEEKSA